MASDEQTDAIASEIGESAVTWEQFADRHYPFFHDEPPMSDEIIDAGEPEMEPDVAPMLPLPPTRQKLMSFAQLQQAVERAALDSGVAPERLRRGDGRTIRSRRENA